EVLVHPYLAAGQHGEPARHDVVRRVRHVQVVPVRQEAGGVAAKVILDALLAPFGRSAFGPHLLQALLERRDRAAVLGYGPPRTGILRAHALAFAGRAVGNAGSAVRSRTLVRAGLDVRRRSVQRGEAADHRAVAIDLVDARLTEGVHVAER